MLFDFAQQMANFILILFVLRLVQLKLLKDPNSASGKALSYLLH